MRSKVTAVDEAAEKIKSGDAVTISGNGEALLPDFVLQALERKFLCSDQPRDLTLYRQPCEDNVECIISRG